ncbi:hypothetical protein BLJAPNOD_05120 [Ensifer sp. M14]|nr:hypothetical protein BLJAPNOD_05120 [Ensifer sp. M14]
MMAMYQGNEASELIETWILSPAATLGSSVRAKGILLEIRARLPFPVRKSLDLKASVLTLALPTNSEDEFRAAKLAISKALEGIENLPIIPREIEDILTISTTERHRWLKEGRLPSAGTRTVKLRGRARKITFHVFDARLVEEMLNGDLVTIWREEDAQTAAENRRRAALKAKMTRSLKNKPKARSASEDNPDEGLYPKLRGWEEFDRDGLLR